MLYCNVLTFIVIVITGRGSHRGAREGDQPHHPVHGRQRQGAAGGPRAAGRALHRLLAPLPAPLLPNVPF